jgi:hypothetical protein
VICGQRSSLFPFSSSALFLRAAAFPPLIPIRDICSRSRLKMLPPFFPASRASSLVNSCARPRGVRPLASAARNRSALL